MYNIKGQKAEKVDSTTLSVLGYQESDLEEIIRTNINMLCDEE